MKIVGAHQIPAKGSVIVVANHVSEGDGALLRRATKRKLEVVSRSRELEPNELAVIFPEGAPSRTGTIETFTAEVEELIARNPSARIVPACFCPAKSTGPGVLLFGSPCEGPMTAPELRQKIVELSSEAIEHLKTGDRTLAHRLIGSARKHWSKPAIADSSRRSLSYGETLTEALIFRKWLTNARPNEANIGVFLPASVMTALINYGITLAGKTAVNLNFTAGEQNCRAAVAQCEIRTVITSKAFLDRADLAQWAEMVLIEDVLAGFTPSDRWRARLSARFAPLTALTRGIRPETRACVLFSSGSTGVPKGVELTHWNILTNADGCAAVIPIRESDCMLGVLPFFHSFGYTFALWFPLLEGFRAVYHSNPTDAKTVGELVSAHRATFFLSTPTFCLQYARKCEREQFGTLKYILVGAEKLRDSAAEEFRRHFGIELLAGYGCTELGPGVAINRPDVAEGETIHRGTRPGSVGRPLPGIAVRIADPETGKLLPAGQQGMVLVKGPSRMPGYYGAPERTAEVLRDGYYVTGDLGYVDDDGFLYITDRLARFSKIGGEMAPHLRIEEAVADLTPSFVTGVPDARRGERLVLLYTNPEVTPAELSARLTGSGLPALWIPKRENIYPVATIPTLANGKVDLKRARELAISAAVPEASRNANYV